MTTIEIFINRALDKIGIEEQLPYVQESFYLYGVAVLEIIWDRDSRGYYQVEKVEHRDPKEVFFDWRMVNSKFLIFREYPTTEVFEREVNRTIVRQLVKVNFNEKRKEFPVWKMTKKGLGE